MKSFANGILPVCNYGRRLVNEMRNGVPSKEVREAILDGTDIFFARYDYKKVTIDGLASKGCQHRRPAFIRFAQGAQLKS